MNTTEAPEWAQKMAAELMDHYRELVAESIELTGPAVTL